MSRRPLLSIVCPAFEEARVLPAFHGALCSAVLPLQAALDIEIVYVDDGSRDRTFSVIEELASHDPRIRAISLSRNFGHQAALTAGLDLARGDAVVTLDTDLQHPPALIPALVAQWQAGFDVVQTIRQQDRRLSWFKRTSSNWFYRLFRRWSGVEIQAAAADYRLLSRRAVDALLSLRESHRFLRGMVRWLGFPVAEIPFQPDPRGAGVSKYTFRKMLRLAFDGLCSFSRAPLRLSVAFGLVATGLCAVTSMGIAIAHGVSVGWLCVGLLAHIVVAAHFAALGVLGEYVGRIYEEAKRRPLYMVKAEIGTAQDAVRGNVRSAA